MPVQRLYGIFRWVVIQRDPTVRQEDGHFVPLPIQISHGLPMAVFGGT